MVLPQARLSAPAANTSPEVAPPDYDIQTEALRTGNDRQGASVGFTYL